VIGSLGNSLGSQGGVDLLMHGAVAFGRSITAGEAIFKQICMTGVFNVEAAMTGATNLAASMTGATNLAASMLGRANLAESMTGVFDVDREMTGVVEGC